MKRSIKLMSFALALSMTTALGPQALAQTQPANAGAPPAQSQPQQQSTSQQTQT